MGYWLRLLLVDVIQIDECVCVCPVRGRGQSCAPGLAGV